MRIFEIVTVYTQPCHHILRNRNISVCLSSLPQTVSKSPNLNLFHCFICWFVGIFILFTWNSIVVNIFFFRLLIVYCSQNTWMLTVLTCGWIVFCILRISSFYTEQLTYLTFVTVIFGETVGVESFYCAQFSLTT